MKYRRVKGYKYKLEADYKVSVPVNVNCHNDYISLDRGVLIIKFSYAWDGSSIPLKKYFSWVYDFDKHCKTASLVHDSLCQLMRENLLDKKFKELIDGIYRDMCIEGGLSKRNADRRYKYLRRYGDPYIRNIDKRGKVFEI